MFINKKKNGFAGKQTILDMERSETRTDKIFVNFVKYVAFSLLHLEFNLFKPISKIVFQQHNDNNILNMYLNYS